MKRLAAPFEALVAPLAPIYAGVMKARNLAYDHGWLSSYRIGKPVVSIGNLTAGGTGKTPLTALLIEGLLERDVKVGVISRGYRGTTPGQERVKPDGSVESARRFGDEPTWLAAKFPGVPVYVGTNKVAVCETLLERENVDVILADDAFQHRRLKRSIDAVVIDATEPVWHYRPLPLGRMREGFSSLNRAQAVFLTKTNLASREHVAWLKQKIALVDGAAVESRVFEMESRITAFDPLRGANSSTDAPMATGDRVLLVSGIGRPATFESSVREACGAEIAGHLVFADHHGYGPEDFARIEAEASRLAVRTVIVTEKDAVKMTAWNPSVEVRVSRLETRPRSDLGAFYEAVVGLLL